MRPKYKIGTMVQFGNAQTGLVEAVITRENGFGYYVSGHTTPFTDRDGNTAGIAQEIHEESITGAFRAVKARSVSPRKTSATKNSSLKSNTKKIANGVAHAS